MNPVHRRASVPAARPLPTFLQASPREGKADPEAHRRPGGGNRRKIKRGPATAEKKGMYHGIKIPLGAFEKPFAGGSQLDALPGRLESLVFPHRWACGCFARYACMHTAVVQKKKKQGRKERMNEEEKTGCMVCTPWSEEVLAQFLVLIQKEEVMEKK